jgi:hypothetical protein
MKLLAQLISSVFLSVLFLSCCPEGEQEMFIFNIESIKPLNFNHNTIDFIEGNGTDISAISYAIVFQTTAPGIKNAKPKSRGAGIFKSPDCSSNMDPIFLLEDEIVDFNITATESFSPNFPAGSDLTEFFNPILITKDNPFSTPPSSVENLFDKVNFQELNKYFIRHHMTVDYSNQEEKSFYGLKLRELPTSTVQIQFKLELTFQSGRTMNGSTEPVSLF